jgi:glycerol-3-phosphate dehydrogenase
MYDILIIGGGATGSGIALDSALRGFKTILFEQNDFAEGTSSRSTKLAHGGVRYLEAAVKHLDKKQFSLVLEGLRERYRILNNAPHLSNRLSLITPVYKWLQVPYIYSGLVLYDLLSGKFRVGRSSLILNKAENLPVKKYKAAVKYYDGQFLDARMVIAILKTAAENGAEIYNHHKVTGFIFDKGKIVGVEVLDRESGEIKKIYSKTVINATGPFSDEIRKMADKNVKNIIVPSRGVHIVLDKKFLPVNEGLLIPKTEDGRVLFILPFMDKCLVGTTDVEADIEEHPKVSEEEIDYILKHINRYFTLNVTKDDILASFAGIRPLVSLDKKTNTANIVREHIIEKLECGLVTIAGGKWTTYRQMAQDAVDFVIKNFGFKDIKCRTYDYKLIGSRNLKEAYEKYKNGKYERLLKLYGDETEQVLKMGEDVLVEDILKGEVLFSIRMEYAKKPLDFIVRRSMVGIVDRVKAKRILEPVCKIFKKELGWSDEKYQNELISAQKILDTDI